VDASALDLIEVYGRVVNCNGQALGNAYVQVTYPGALGHFGFTEADGTFSTTWPNCSNSATAKVQAFDLDNLLESDLLEFPVNSPPVNTGDIPVCNALEEYIRYTINGNNATLIYPYAYTNNGTLYLSAIDSLQNGNGIDLGFNPNAQPGTYPLQSLYVRNINSEISPAQAANVSSTLTNYPAVSDFFTGTFGGNFQSVNGANHTISGSYRVRRTQ
jgi:hypothetical protein